MRLAQLLDMSLVQRLADASYNANGMPMSIIDAVDAAVLVSCGWQDICVRFHRVHPRSRARCEESDRYIQGHLRQAERCEYRCQNGLRQIAIPILAGGEHLATMFLGQFFYEGEAPDRDFFARQAAAFGFDERRYLAALDRVPVFSRSVVENVLAYDAALARFIADVAEGTLRRDAASRALAAEKERLARAEEELRRVHERAASVARVVEENPEPVLRVGGGALLYANPAARSALAALGPLDPGVPAPPEIAAPAAEALRAGRLQIEIPCGDRLFAMSFCPVGREVNVYGHEITERKRAEADLAVYTRLYAVLSRVNEAIVRTRDEPALFTEVCRIVADEGGFPLVWVGLVNGRAVVPAAAWGSAATYLREVEVAVDGELGQGPTGTCIREDRPVLNDDFGVNPSTWPWREATLRYGLRASAAFPLRRGGEAIGALTFYAGEPGAFTARQVKLLEALCADLSYALDALEQERLRTDAERALRESEQSLREADRRKDEFLGMLSHELRNPLAPIRNSVYILEHAAPSGEEAARARGVIQRQAEHLTRLVDDLLDITRIARGKIDLRRARLELRELVVRAADDFQLMLHDRGVAFRTALPDAEAWVDGDATRITQVVGNLLHNAAKFTRRGDEVTLTLGMVAGSAELSVRDTGAGIEPALLPTVFDAFVQGERTLARTEGGLGLGLALVRGIAELHGGSVRAVSAGKGRGAEFVVRLPLATPAPAVSPPRPLASRAVARRRVLVVDDNTDAAESLADIVTLLGHSVEVAHDGPTALEKARAQAPHFVLCDIGLPGMSGYDVARALRASGQAGLHLVALSGYAQPEDVRTALDAGFDWHVAKPASIEELERLLTS